MREVINGKDDKISSGEKASRSRARKLKALFGRPEIMSVTEFSKISAVLNRAIKKAKQS
jgi:hypothetical protein